MVIDTDRLTPKEKFLLGMELLDAADREGFHPPDDPEAEDLHAMLDRRIAEHEADPEGGSPWEVVRERIREHLQQVRHGA